MAIKTYRFESDGSFSSLDQSSISGVTDLALARISPTTFVTPARLSNGLQRVLAWSIDVHGNIGLRTLYDTDPVDSIEAVTAFHPAYPTLTVLGGFNVYTRVSGGLVVTSWKLLEDEDNDAMLLPHSEELAGTIPAGASASELDFDLAATVVRTSTNMQKVIAWRTNYIGDLTRGGSATTTMQCNRVTSAAIGTRFLATACRRTDLSMDVRLFEVASGGATVTQRDTTTGGRGRVSCACPSNGSICVSSPPVPSTPIPHCPSKARSSGIRPSTSRRSTRSGSTASAPHSTTAPIARRWTATASRT
jgi:hypothetical protein